MPDGDFLKIGNLTIDGYAALAPMAGVADRTFRELCAGFGAAVTFSELVSAKAVSLGDAKSLGLLSVHDAERPMGVQIFGNDPEIMARAASVAALSKPDFIDINMGCPAKKIISNRSGAFLMKHPVLAEKIVAAVVRAVDVPVSVKMRIGWDDDSVNCVELAKRAESAGARMVTVHGRTKTQMYAPPVNLEQIRAVKAALSVPVIGNGDIFSARDAADMYEQTGCDLVMVGRGAMGNPWIFSRINALLEHGQTLPTPSLAEKMRVLIAHMQTAVDYRGEYIAIREARKHAAWYLRGVRGAAEYRNLAGKLETMDDLKRFAAMVACKESFSHPDYN